MLAVNKQDVELRPHNSNEKHYTYNKKKIFKHLTTAVYTMCAEHGHNLSLHIKYNLFKLAEKIPNFQIRGG